MFFFMFLFHESTRACWKISGQDQAEMRVKSAHFMAAAFGVWLGRISSNGAESTRCALALL